MSNDDPDHFPVSLDFEVLQLKGGRLEDSSVPEVIKLFMLNSAEQEIYPAHKC